MNEWEESTKSWTELSDDRQKMCISRETLEGLCFTGMLHSSSHYTITRWFSIAYELMLVVQSLSPLPPKVKTVTKLV